jgi:hypothetical protein
MLYSHIKKVVNILVIKKMGCGMVKVNFIIKMEVITKVNGKTIICMVTVNYSIKI